MAILIHPNTLSCVFTKVHSERATGIAGKPTWQLGGACTYGAIRLHAHNPDVASGAVVGQQTVIANLRVDDADRIPIRVDATGGSVTFTEVVATLDNVPTQAGRVTVQGGTVKALRIGDGWSFYNCRLSRLEIGFMPPRGEARANGCAIAMLLPERGQTQGTITLTDCVVRRAIFGDDQARLRQIRLLGGTTCSVAAPGRVAYQIVDVDTFSTLVGGIRVDHAALRLNGTLDGDLTVAAPAQSLAGAGAVVTGRVSGWSYPRATDILGAHHQGMYCKNLGLVPGEASAPAGWISDGKGWRSV